MVKFEYRVVYVLYLYLIDSLCSIVRDIFKFLNENRFLLPPPGSLLRFLFPRSRLRSYLIWFTLNSRNESQKQRLYFYETISGEKCAYYSKIQIELQRCENIKNRLSRIRDLVRSNCTMSTDLDKPWWLSKTIRRISTPARFIMLII